MSDCTLLVTLRFKAERVTSLRYVAAVLHNIPLNEELQEHSTVVELVSAVIEGEVTV